MKLFYSDMINTVSKVRVFLVCSFLSISIGIFAVPIQVELSKVDEFIKSGEFENCIVFSNKIFQSYLIQGEVASAYSILIKHLDCLSGAKKTAEFLRVSNKIKQDLDPYKNQELIREVYRKRCLFFSNTDLEALEDEFFEIMEFEKKYGSDDEYVHSVLIYTSRMKSKGELENIDNLKMLLEIEPLVSSDANKFMYYRRLGTLYHHENVTKADSFFRLALPYEFAAPDEISKAAFHREYARFLGNASKYAMSTKHALIALDYYERDENLYLPKTQLLSFIANNFVGIGQLDRAREYIDRAIEIADEKGLKYRDGLAKIHANILMKENDLQLAIKEYRRSVEYFKGHQDLVVVNCMAKIGTIYLQLNDLEKAKEIEKEINSFLDSKEIHGSVYSNLLFSADLAIEEARWNDAEKYYNRILTEHISIFPIIESSIYKGLAKTMWAKKNYEQAYIYSNKYKMISDSLNKIRNVEVALSLESEYNRAKKNDEISLLNSANELQKVRLSGQRKFLIFTSAAFFVFVVLSFLLLRLFGKVKMQNQLINTSIEEKNILLKEIHHRVKNNLQLVSSLLTLQSREIKDEKAIEAINEGKSRVRSMALIHQDLYSRESLTGIGMKKYLENLSQELFSTYQLEHQDIQLNLNIDDVYLDVDTIVPIGLIINELITNALKYAFEGKEAGVLTISFTERNNVLVLDVEDDGKGMLEDGFNSPNSFGNKLITTLTEQLDGTIKIDGSNGTHVHLEFKEYSLAS